MIMLPIGTCWILWLNSLFVHVLISLYMLWYTNRPCSPWAHAESVKIFSKRITWLYNSTMWVWPSYHQWLIHTSISQSSGYIKNLTHPLNQVGIYQLFIHDRNNKYYIIHPMKSGDTNYIIFPRGLIQMYEKTYHTLNVYMT